MKAINVVASVALVLTFTGSKFVLPASAAQASELLDGIKNSDVEAVRRSIDGGDAGVVVRQNRRLQALQEPSTRSESTAPSPPLPASVPAQAKTDSKPSEQLMAAAKDGNLEEVQRLIDAGAHLPGTLNSLRAIKFAKDGGHDEVLELLEAGLNEYIEAGTFYDNMIERLVEDFRTKAEEDPGSIRWNMVKRVTVSLTIGFYNGVKQIPNGLMYPLGVAFDEEEFRRRFDLVFEALQKEYEVESDFDRQMRENEEAWEALMKKIQAKTDEKEEENER